MHRRRLLVALSGLVVLAVGVTAWAVVPSSIPVVTAAESRVVHLYRHGPGGSCDGDACGIGVVDPMRFRLPAAGTTYSGTVTVSFSYTTKGNGIQRIVMGLDNAGTRHHRGTVLPARREIAPAPFPSSTTLVFRVLDVPADTLLDLSPGLEFGERDRPRASFTSSNVLVELRVSPTG